MSNFIGFWMRERGRGGGRKGERDGFNGVSRIRMLVKDMSPAALERESCDIKSSTGRGGCLLEWFLGFNTAAKRI